MSHKPYVVFKHKESRIAVLPEQVTAILSSKERRYHPGPETFDKREYFVEICTLFVLGEYGSADGNGLTVEGTLEEVISALKGES